MRADGGLLRAVGFGAEIRPGCRATVAPWALDHWFYSVLHCQEVEDQGRNAGEFRGEGYVEQAFADVLLWIRPHGCRVRIDLLWDMDVMSHLHSNHEAQLCQE